MSVSLRSLEGLAMVGYMLSLISVCGTTSGKKILSNYIGVNISHKKLCIFMELKNILMRVLITSHMCLFSWLVLAVDHNFQALRREKCPQTALLLWSTGDSSPEDQAPACPQPLPFFTQNWMEARGEGSRT